MATITVLQEDIDSAETFITQVLQEQVPDGDYRPGSALRDLVVKALAVMVAVQRADAERVLNYTSIARVDFLDDDQERLEAIQANAANWYVTPRAGTYVRGAALLHFTGPHDGSVPVGTRFVRDTTIAFTLDQSTAYTYSSNDFTAITDGNGVITSYAIRIPVVAEDVGNSYAISAGEFSFVTPPFSTRFLYAENEQAFGAVDDPESADELLERIPDAITVRDLVSKRSITTVIQENYPEVNRIVVQGMGDEGQIRDLLNDPTAFFKIHLGGAIDIFIGSTILSEQVFEGEIGGSYTDPRNGVTLLQDASVEDFRRFVRVGDVIRIYNAGSNEPGLYLIDEITEAHLRVVPRQPFPEARPVLLRDSTAFTTGTVVAPDQLVDFNVDFTASDVGNYVRIFGSSVGNDGTYRIDAVDVANGTATLDAALSSEAPPNFSFTLQSGLVDYSVGDNEPSFDNHVSRRDTGSFSVGYAVSGEAILPDIPIYLIREVSIYDPADPDADATSGRVVFPNRVNRQPQANSGANLEYQIDIKDPSVAYSSRQFPVLRLGYAPEQYGTAGSLSIGYVFRDPTYSFSVNDVGKTIFIEEAVTANNRGQFLISGHVPSLGIPDGVTLSNPRDPLWVPTAENGLVWNMNQQDKYDGKTVRVTYDTISAFQAIDAYVNADDERVTNADTLVRGFMPVYVAFDMEYRLKRTAATGIDEEEAVTFLVDYINTFPAEDVLHVSDLMAALYDYAPESVGAVLPFRVYYWLYAPDGRLIPYATSDAVEMTPGLSAAVTDDEKLDDPAALGVTASTVRFLTTAEHITLTQVF